MTDENLRVMRRDALIELYWEAWRNLYECDASPNTPQYSRAGGYFTGVTHALEAMGFSGEQRHLLRQGFRCRLRQEEEDDGQE